MQLEERRRVHRTGALLRDGREAQGTGEACGGVGVHRIARHGRGAYLARGEEKGFGDQNREEEEQGRRRQLGDSLHGRRSIYRPRSFMSLQSFWSFATYPYRNACVGLTRVARAPGIAPARRATTTRIAVDAASVTGSWPDSPNSRLFTSFAAARANSRPTATPAMASSIVSRSTIESTSLRCAPSAMRMPISLTRREMV